MVSELGLFLCILLYLRRHSQDAGQVGALGVTPICWRLVGLGVLLLQKTLVFTDAMYEALVGGAGRLRRAKSLRADGLMPRVCLFFLVLSPPAYPLADRYVGGFLVCLFHWSLRYAVCRYTPLGRLAIRTAHTAARRSFLSDLPKC